MNICAEINNKSNPEKKTLYHMNHNSDVLVSMRRLIVETISPKSSREMKDLLLQYLHVLKILLINEYNQREAIKLDLHDILVSITLTDKIERGVRFKAVDSLSFLIHQGNLVNKITKDNTFCEWLSGTLVDLPQDMFSTGRVLEIFIQCFKSSIVTKKLLDINENLVNQIIRILAKTKADHKALEANLKVSPSRFIVQGPPRFLQELKFH